MTHLGYLVAGCAISLVVLGGYGLRLARRGRSLSPFVPADQSARDAISTFVPADQSARDAISTRLDGNLFVEAGAGTGKTTALVGRMVALVLGDQMPVESIVAITFTELAATELRDRFRQALEANSASAWAKAGLALVARSVGGDSAWADALAAEARLLSRSEAADAGC